MIERLAGRFRSCLTMQGYGSLSDGERRSLWLGLRFSPALCLAGIELRRVETPEDAERERFLGSPTVRIDGEDVDPGAGEREDFGLKCRLYRTAAGLKPVPPDEWIRKTLRGAG